MVFVNAKAFQSIPAQSTILACAWGVQSVIVEAPKRTRDLFMAIDDRLMEGRLARPGETVVIVSKEPLSSSQRTNTVHLHMVGSAKALPW